MLYIELYNVCILSNENKCINNNIGTLHCIAFPSTQQGSITTDYSRSGSAYPGTALLCGVRVPGIDTACRAMAVDTACRAMAIFHYVRRRCAAQTRSSWCQGGFD